MEESTTRPKLTIEEVAKLSRNLNRMYCAALGDPVQEIWEKSTEVERQQLVNNVKYHLENDQTPQESHMSWVRQKIADGWCYDINRDDTLKLHPCLIPYEQLPVEQRAKDHILRGLVRGLKPFIEE